MQHFAARQGLCATEKGLTLLNSPELSPINLSTLAPKSMEHANINQGSIGTMNRRNPPLLMSAKNTKNHLEGPKSTYKTRIY
jgi:hypothetical protein